LGDRATAKGMIDGPNGEKVAFFATSVVQTVTIKQRARKDLVLHTINNYISTYPLSELVLEKINVERVVEKDGSVATVYSAIWNEGGVVSYFNSKAGYIDSINKEILRLFPSFCEMRWKVRMILTVFYGMLNNAKHLKRLWLAQKAENNDSISMKIHSYDWSMAAANVLSPCDPIEPNLRFLSLHHFPNFFL